MNKVWSSVAIAIVCLPFIACSLAKGVSQVAIETAMVETQMAAPTNPPTSIPTEPPPTPAYVLNFPGTYCTGQLIYSGGYTVTQVNCTWQKAYCRGGGGIWCYDSPPPNDKISVYLNDHDLTVYDGQCLLVTGVLGTMGGKPVLTAESPSEIAACP